MLGLDSRRSIGNKASSCSELDRVGRRFLAYVFDRTICGRIIQLFGGEKGVDDLKRVIRYIFLGVGIALLVSGCSSAAASKNANEVEVALKEYSIGTGDIRLTQTDTAAKVTIKNQGMNVHNFVIPELGIDSGLIQPGESITLELNVKEEKVVQAKCTLPGHTEAGMIAKVMIGQ